MQAYIPEFILAGLAMILLLAETFFKKAPKFVFGLIGAAGALAMLPFYMESLYANTYIILALVATAITLLLSVDFRAVINLSSNDSKTQDGTGNSTSCRCSPAWGSPPCARPPTWWNSSFPWKCSH